MSGIFPFHSFSNISKLSHFLCLVFLSMCLKSSSLNNSSYKDLHCAADSNPKQELLLISEYEHSLYNSVSEVDLLDERLCMFQILVNTVKELC